MYKNTVSKISNAFSTGGGGTNFEQQIQVMFLLSLLVDGFCPAMNELTKRVCFQAKHLGYNVDDLVIFTDRGQNEGKLLCQVKHSITATENDKTFQEVICAAWSDLNKENFDENRDRIALVTALISNNALRSLRFLHAQATAATDENEFFERVNTPYFSKKDNSNMLTTLKSTITGSKGSEATKQEVWKFCKAFILLLFDMDCEESVNRALSTSLVKCNSPMDATLVWSRLVVYAGECNQKAASIDRNNIDNGIKTLFWGKNVIQAPPEPIKVIDLFVPTIAIIGSWNEENEYDCKIIEKISGMSYSEFKAKARGMLVQNPEYLQLNNGNIWNVLHKEELLEQCKDILFDDCLGQLFEALKAVLIQKSKRVQSQTPYYITSGGEYDNSHLIRNSLVNSTCWIKKNLSTLTKCNHNRIETNAAQLIKELLGNAGWVLWASLSDCLQNLAELSPVAFLDVVEQSILNAPAEMLRLFPKKDSSLFQSTSYISGLLWALEVLAWSPDYVVRSIRVLGLMEALPYEKTNWVNTPGNSIVSILLPWYPQTMADLDKRKNALSCLKSDSTEIFWRILVKLLPNRTTSTSGNPKPQYSSLNIPEEMSVTNLEVYDYYDFLLKMAVEIACDAPEMIVDLIDQIGHMYEPVLSKYLSCIENCKDSISDDYSFEIWLKLHERMAIIKPTKEKVIYQQLDRIERLIEKLEPVDIRLKYRELYLGNRYLFENGEFETKWEMMEQQKTVAVNDIFVQYGIVETEKFGRSVKNLSDVAYRLGKSLSQDELSLVIDECASKKVTETFSALCVSGFISSQGAENLLNTSLVKANEDLILGLLSHITFSMQLLAVVDKLLPDTSSYWRKACIRYAYSKENADELKLVVDKLISCKRNVTAVNIIGRSQLASVFEAVYVWKLLKITGTEESVGTETLDDYAVQNIIGWLQKQESLSLEMRSDIEFIYLPLLNSPSKVQPHTLYSQLGLNPEYFCSLIELFYKKNTSDKHEFVLNKGLSDRLFEILFQFKVTPGIDLNGTFDSNAFRSWMEYVKTWSLENERYEVTMHTVGSGLSYAPLDENRMPPIAILEELNRPENEELRRGYYLGIINQRGVHIVDPEGKPEMELAKENRQMAEMAEAKGYSRYADVLKEIAVQYDREAQRNIAEALNKY